jgi:hypothetical protein
MGSRRVPSRGYGRLRSRGLLLSARHCLTRPLSFGISGTLSISIGRVLREMSGGTRPSRGQRALRAEFVAHNSPEVLPTGYSVSEPTSSKPGRQISTLAWMRREGIPDPHRRHHTYALTKRR